PSKEALKREKALLAEHKLRWLGSLAGMVKTQKPTFERGFLDACALKGTWDQRLVDDPAWAAVGAIALGNSGMIQLAKITRPLRLESIEWELRNAVSLDYGLRTAIEAFQQLELPHLRKVRIFGDLFAVVDRGWIEEARTARNLEIHLG